MNALQIPFMVFLWASVIYLFASTVFLIVKNDLTAYLSAIFYLAGSFLYAVSDLMRIICTDGLSRKENICHFIADLMLTVGSIFFFPSLNKTIVGNWIFEIGGWINIITNATAAYQLYQLQLTSKL